MGLFVDHMYISGFDGSIRDAEGNTMWDGYVVYRQATWRYLAGRAIWRANLKSIPVQRVLDRVVPPKGEDRIPVSSRIDIWLFDFTHAGRTPVAEWTTPRTEPLPDE